jgi:hypothetical protein
LVTEGVGVLVLVGVVVLVGVIVGVGVLVGVVVGVFVGVVVGAGVEVGVGVGPGIQGFTVVQAVQDEYEVKFIVNKLYIGVPETNPVVKY